MADIFPPAQQRLALLDLAKALGSRDNALRRDECGDWRINGKGGHVYAVPGGFQVVVLSEKLETGLVDRWTSQGWTYAKRALTFAKLMNDGDLEGTFMLDRLPTPAEAELIRRYCMIGKKAEFSEEELARRRTWASTVNDGSGKKPASDDMPVPEGLQGW